MFVLMWVLVGVVVLMAFDILGRLVLHGEPSYTHRLNGKNTGNLFVYFPGILSDGVESSESLVEAWLGRGDVLIVSYHGKRFIPNVIVANTIAWLLKSGQHYTKVVFIGASMGGLLAYDTYGALGNELTPYTSEFILIDAPTSRGDLQSPLDIISLGSKIWWAGPISNLFSSLYFRLTFVKPKEENIEPGVDREKLAKHVALCMSFPLSWSMDQTRFIISHPPVTERSLAGVHVIYVRSTRDNDTVRQEAYDKWNAACRHKAVEVQVDSTHVGFSERPSTWWEAFMDTILPKV